MRAPSPPSDDDACGWWNVLPPPPPARRLAGDAVADCVVVGAGFTGLAIARQLALRRPGWQIALVEGQFFGRLGTELYASLGYNGTGVSMGTASGMLLADYAVGAESALLSDALALPRPAWLPPQPFLGWGVRSRVAFLRQRAGAER
jgi:glycine/D-amino acid oxidase-like deaminating enzyme